MRIKHPVLRGASGRPGLSHGASLWFQSVAGREGAGCGEGTEDPILVLLKNRVTSVPAPSAFLPWCFEHSVTEAVTVFCFRKINLAAGSRNRKID